MKLQKVKNCLTKTCSITVSGEKFAIKNAVKYLDFYDKNLNYQEEVKNAL